MEKLLSRTTLSPSLSNPRCFAFLSFESSLAEDVEARNNQAASSVYNPCCNLTLSPYTYLRFNFHLFKSLIYRMPVAKLRIQVPTLPKAIF